MKLEFPEPGTPGSYEEITWYKGSTSGGDRIVFFISGALNYYGEYCSGSSPCSTSSKGELNTDTGEFTIYRALPTDADYYYYKFYSSGTPDTGRKYEIILHVN